MNHKLIKVAIAYPHAYPWGREKLFLDDCELDQLLKSYNLETETKRRNAGWKIKFNILKEVSKSKNASELLQLVFNNLKNESYCSESIINLYIRKLKLENSENLVSFNKLLTNQISPNEIESNLDLFIIWLVDIFAYYNCSTNEMSSRELQNIIVDYLNTSLTPNNTYDELVKNQMYKVGLLKNNVLKLFTLEISEYKNEIQSLFSNLINNKSVTENTTVQHESSNSTELKDSLEGDISDSILSLFNNSTSLKLNEEELNEMNQQKEIHSNENIDSQANETNTLVKNEDVESSNENDKIFTDLKSLANTLGYKIADKDEVILSKDKYDKLINSDKDKEITLLKELALLKNGAILSELYNAYKNINEISKENIEAILTNFFFTLNVNGFEANDDTNSVGQIIEVNTSNVLKEFVFTEANNKEGFVKAKIEYLGWKYKGKQIVPMAVKALE